MKTLISCAIASTVLPFLVACGPSDEVELDERVLSSGESNRVTTGGFWWAYADRSQTSKIIPSTAKDLGHNPKPGMSRGNGIEKDTDAAHGYVVHVTGVVGPAPHWTLTLGTAPPEAGNKDWRDLYWDQFYGHDPSACIGGFCGEVAYPAAGVGFGMLPKNKVISLAAYAGVYFDIKAGPNHAVDATSGLQQPVAFSVPIETTDVPDPDWEDDFVRTCTFPQSPKAPGSAEVVGPQKKSCFGNYIASIQLSPVWQRFCVLWTDLAKPSWAEEALTAEGIEFDPSRILKMQWDAYKPPEGAATAPFDIYLDNVGTFDADNYPTVCAGATPLAGAGTP